MEEKHENYNGDL